MSGLLAAVAVASALGACGGAVEGDRGEPTSDPFAGGSTEPRASFDADCDASGQCVMVAPLLAAAHDAISLPRGSVFANDVGTSSDESVARVDRVTTTCFCELSTPSSTSVRSVELQAACATSEVRECMDDIAIESRSTGHAEIVVSDLSGGVFRRVSLEVREVATLRLVPRLEEPTGDEGVVRYSWGPPMAPAADGALELDVGDVAQIEVVFRDDAGRPLRFQRSGAFAATVEDRTVLDDDLALGLGGLAPRRPQRFQAIAAGTSRITVAGRGVRDELVIRGVSR